MNKELIRKYKAEFNWWLDGGEVLIRFYNHSEWELINDDNLDEDHFWSNEIGSFKELKVVIKDKYYPFRKALAEGKTIQDDTGLYWSKSLCKWDLPPERYRIKPDEPTFEVGDWVVHPRIVSPFRWTKNDTCPKTELWKPKVDEWCWFLDNQKEPRLKQYECLDPIGNCHVSKQGLMSHKVEPFIGTLPSCIKGIK